MTDNWPEEANALINELYQNNKNLTANDCLTSEKFRTQFPNLKKANFEAKLRYIRGDSSGKYFSFEVPNTAVGGKRKADAVHHRNPDADPVGDLEPLIQDRGYKARALTYAPLVMQMEVIPHEFLGIRTLRIVDTLYIVIPKPGLRCDLQAHWDAAAPSELSITARWPPLIIPSLDPHLAIDRTPLFETSHTLEWPIFHPAFSHTDQMLFIKAPIFGAEMAHAGSDQCKCPSCLFSHNSR